MTVTFVSYVFNLNLGSLVGGVAFRYRLYSRLGNHAHVHTLLFGGAGQRGLDAIRVKTGPAAGC